MRGAGKLAAAVGDFQRFRAIYRSNHLSAALPNICCAAARFQSAGGSLQTRLLARGIRESSRARVPGVFAAARRKRRPRGRAAGLVSESALHLFALFCRRLKSPACAERPTGLAGLCLAFSFVASST